MKFGEIENDSTNPGDSQAVDSRHVYKLSLVKLVEWGSPLTLLFAFSFSLSPNTPSLGVGAVAVVIF